MGKNLDINQNRNRLQDSYTQLILARVYKAKKNFETTRLVIDIQKGLINSIQDQNIIAGVTALENYLDMIK